MKGEVSTSPAETGIDACRNAFSLSYYSSGSKSVDSMLGGGFRAGTLTHVYGKSGSGKSQLAMQAVLTAAKNGTRSLYLDTEGAFRPERIEEMAKSRGIPSDGLLDGIIYVRTDSSSGQMETIRSIPSRQSPIRQSSCAICGATSETSALRQPPTMPDLGAFATGSPADAACRGRPMHM